jgi:YD repeat-containing protein
MKSHARIEFAIGLAAYLLLSAFANLARPAPITYSYDNAGRLVGADYGASVTTSYAYDNSGNLLQTASPRPAIEATLLGNNQLLLVWSMFPAGYVLESADSLSAPIQWGPVSTAPAVNGDQKSVTVDISTGAKFYRLKKL